MLVFFFNNNKVGLVIQGALEFHSSSVVRAPDRALCKRQRDLWTSRTPGALEVALKREVKMKSDGDFFRKLNSFLCSEGLSHDSLQMVERKEHGGTSLLQE